MDNLISQGELKEIEKVKGEARGVVFKPELEFVLKEEGREGLEKLEKAMEKLGHPLKYDEVKSMSFYPLKRKALMLVLMSKIFNYSEENFEEIGRSAAKFPVLLRRLMRLVMGDKIVTEGNKIWQKYLTAGRSELVKFNRQDKIEILRLHDFDVNPLECRFLVGYFASLLRVLVKSEVRCEETRCTFKGDDYHEFVLKW